MSDMDRRTFLRLTGIGAIFGLGGLSLFEVVTERYLEALDRKFAETPETLKAKRWAMVIDINKFKTEEDYRKVIEACHKTHNVPDFGNPKDEVKWIWTDKFVHAFPGQEYEYMPQELKEKPFLLLCNHCENPPCVRVCPTKATFKTKEGITMQDMHRCIGCRFCMAACPYGARSFNWRDPRPFIKEVNKEYPTRNIGVVEKCTFCVERLNKGLRPACVEASEGKILFGDLRDPSSDVRVALSKNFAIRRKAELGTQPGVFYIIGGSENA